MNLQSLAAMDDCEHATGKGLEEHRKIRTPKEIIAEAFKPYEPENELADWAAAELIAELRRAGYDIIQRVGQGNK